MKNHEIWDHVTHREETSEPSLSGIELSKYGGQNNQIYLVTNVPFQNHNCLHVFFTSQDVSIQSF